MTAVAVAGGSLSCVSHARAQGAVVLQCIFDFALAFMQRRTTFSLSHASHPLLTFLATSSRVQTR